MNLVLTGKQGVIRDRFCRALSMFSKPNHRIHKYDERDRQRKKQTNERNKE